MTRNEMNKLIAEKCEGRANFIVGVVFGNLYHRKEDDPAAPLIDVDDYFTDIAACVRAAEAWEAQVEGREWSTGSRKAVLETVPCHSNNSHIISHDGGSPASNLATALVKAVK